eukprot:TRINITY_DN38423_c0_g1_i2.p1 TRINITY_DN38423_c0_g1~~TRINITY_DN38423_c0_g1_i2.p1  ORF type:complete len:602 (+),score=107.26 TRINITY_DN38423_c0_g1_i2:33-1808(+)
MAAVASALISSPAPLGALLLGSRHAVGILRRAHAWKGSAAARRTASQAVIVRLRSLKSPRKVFQFVAEDPQIDAPSLELALRALLRILASGKYSREKVISNVRFHDLLSTLSARLDECDARTLALSADAAARFRAPSKELVAFAERAAEAAVVRRNAFTPRNISLLALACASRGVRGAGAAPVGVHASGDDELATGRGLGAAVEFVRGESFRQMQDFTPASCAMVLEAFWRWGIHDRELFDAALERVWDTYQQLTCKDLVELLVAMSNHGLARPALLRRLSQLAFENLDLFSPRQLVALFHALARFRFLAARDVDDLMEALMPGLRALSDAELARLLFSLALADADHQVDVARLLSAQYAEGRDSPTVVADSDVAWALCAFGLERQGCRKHFEALLERLFERTPPRCPRLRLQLFDVLSAANRGKDGPVAPPSAWLEACAAAAAAHAQQRATVGMSKAHDDIEALLSRVANPVGRPLPPLNWQRGRRAGVFPVDFLEASTSLVLDLELPGSLVTCRVRHRALQDLGYRPLRLDYLDFRAARSDADRSALLGRFLARALTAEGSMPSSRLSGSARLSNFAPTQHSESVGAAL